MVQFHDIASGEEPPKDAGWVLIERTVAGYVATGAAAGTQAATSIGASPFENVEAAIEASESWAAENGVPVVYVRGIP